MSNCRHDWKILNTTVLPSPMEVLVKAGRYPNTKDYNKQKELATNRYICVVACQAGCGKIEILEETNSTG